MDLVKLSSKSIVFKEIPFVRKPILLVILQAYFSEKAVQNKARAYLLYIFCQNVLALIHNNT